MKENKYHSINPVLKSNQTIIDTEAKSIRIYTTAHCSAWYTRIYTTAHCSAWYTRIYTTAHCSTWYTRIYTTAHCSAWYSHSNKNKIARLN